MKQSIQETWHELRRWCQNRQALVAEMTPTEKEELRLLAQLFSGFNGLEPSGKVGR